MKRFLVGPLAALALASPALAQVNLSNLPPNTFVGRSAISAGPAQALPFAQLSTFTFGNASANTMFSGPISGGPAPPAFRPLVGDDLPTINTKDALFGSGRPWCDVRAKGAVGDGVTDDSGAFAACRTAVSALGGGIINIPPGHYCTFSGTSDSAGAFTIQWVGAGTDNTFVDSCNHDVTLFTFTGSYTIVKNLTVYCQGAPPANHATFGATQPCMLLNAGGLQTFDHIIAQGGSNVLKLTGAFETRFEHSSFNFAYGGAILLGQNAGALKIHSSSFDQGWPFINPAPGLVVSARTNTTGYTAGNVVSLSGFYLQAMTTGTSGGSPPALKNYGQIITDGSVTWQVARPVPNYYALQMDTGSNEWFIDVADFSGNYDEGIAMTNSLAGTVPFLLHVQKSVYGGGTNGFFLGNTGHDAAFIDNEILGCLAAGCSLMAINGTWASNFTLLGNRVSGAIASGVANAAGVNAIIESNQMSSNGVDVTVGANINNFIVNSNHANSITVTAGTSDHYRITNNVGATVTDAGTGTDKFVLGNSGVNKLTASLGADVPLNNIANFFDGPSVAQGTSGTWFASGVATLLDASTATFACKLWDGTTVISASAVAAPAGNTQTIGLSGYLTNPAGNIRISCRDFTNTTGNIKFNVSTTSKDATVSVFKIN